MAATATMPDSTSSSSGNGTPISPTGATAVGGRSLPHLQFLPLLDASLYPPPPIAQPRKQRKSRVPSRSSLAAKAARSLNNTKEKVAAEPPTPLLEANIAKESLIVKLPSPSRNVMSISNIVNADNTNAQRALTVPPVVAAAPTPKGSP